jgi:uncharacterized protein YjbI with pentapeptide repeats
MSDSERPKPWKERRQTIKHKWLVPFIFAEWLCEWLSYSLGKWAFIDILGYAGRFAILLAVVSYVRGCPERQRQAEDQRKAKQYQAWQVIIVSHGKPGGGGRKAALEDLYKDDVSLAGVDISRAYLPRLNLAGADLTDANLAGAKLQDANLGGAFLSDANLGGAFLYDANLAGGHLSSADLAGADLRLANLAGAILIDANLAGAFLRAADLAGADLRLANLAGAILVDADLTGADLFEANLAGANLRNTNLQNIKSWRNIRSMKLANIYGVENPPEGFMEWATAPEQGAVLIKDEEEWMKLVVEKRQEQKRRK